MNTKPLSALALMLILGAGVPGFSEDDPRALMLQARSKQRWSAEKEDAAEAAALYRRVIALMPGSSQAQLRLSEALQESGELEAAVPPAVKAAELDPRSGEALAHLALLRYRISLKSPSALALAAQTLKKASRLVPNDFEVSTRLAETLETLKDEEGTLQAWLAVGRLHPMHPFHGGRLLYEYAFERAVELSVQLKQYEPRREAVLALCNRPDPDVRYLRMLEELAQEQAKAGFLAHAEESFALLVRFRPMEPAYLERVARIQLTTARYETARTTFEKAQALRPAAITSYDLAYCSMKLGRFQEAEGILERLLPTLDEANPDEAPLRLPVKSLYACCLLMEGRAQAMLDSIRAWPETASDPDLNVLRAQALIQTGAWKQARVLLKDGMRRFPKQEFFHKASLIPTRTFEEGMFFKAESRNALAQLDQEAMAGLWSGYNCWDKCLAAIQAARKAAPVRDVDLLLLEATALENLGQPDRAMEVLREGQKLDAGNPTLQNNLGYLLLEKGGNVQEASRLIQAALAKEPRNSSTMDSWGWALYKQGNFKEAEEALRKASALSPYSPEIHRHLGDALLKLDRLQEALDEWERALAFVFPERRELEKQVQDLRTRLARSRNAAREEAAETPAQDPVEPAESADGEVDPL